MLKIKIDVKGTCAKMCHTRLGVQLRPQKIGLKHNLGLKHCLVFVFIATMSISTLAAQSSSDEYLSLKSYQLPQDAVPVSQLQLADSLYTLEGQLFSGVAYERYAKGELKNVIHLYQGQLHGPKYMWYQGFKPAMSANYYQGRVRGRLLGWYVNGQILYDMMIGKSSSTNMIESDAPQRDDDIYDTEQEGTDND